MLVHDAQALAAFTGLTVDEVAAFAEQPYEEALRCAFEKRREAQRRFMVTWAPITADVSMLHVALSNCWDKRRSVFKHYR